MDEKNELTERDNSGQEKEPIEEMLEGIPKEHRREIKELMVSSVQMGGMISSENTISKKITEAHISQYLEDSKIAMERHFEEKKHNKIFLGIITAMVMIFLIVLIVLLKDIPDVMEKIIYAAGGVVVGALGGYGFGKGRGREDD